MRVRGRGSFIEALLNKHETCLFRICFVVTLFFLVMALLMVGVKTSRDPRAGLQNGFWGVKYLLIIAGRRKTSVLWSINQC